MNTCQSSLDALKAYARAQCPHGSLSSFPNQPAVVPRRNRGTVDGKRTAGLLQ